MLFANMALIQGNHPDVRNHPDAIAAATTGIKQAIESNNDKSHRYANWQFRLLLLGALFFLGWHITGMVDRTIESNTTTTIAPQSNEPLTEIPGEMIGR